MLETASPDLTVVVDSVVGLADHGLADHVGEREWMMLYVSG